MLRFPKETLVEIVAFLRRFDLDGVELTSQQFRQSLTALSVKPLRRLDVVSLTADGVIIKANGLRHSSGMDEMRASFGGLLRLTKDSVCTSFQVTVVGGMGSNLGFVNSLHFWDLDLKTIFPNFL